MQFDFVRSEYLQNMNSEVPQTYEAICLCKLCLLSNK